MFGNPEHPRWHPCRGQPYLDQLRHPDRTELRFTDVAAAQGREVVAAWSREHR